MVHSHKSGVEPVIFAQAISDAIDSKKVIIFRYDGVSRTVEPHIIGYDRQGHLALSAWQIAGTGKGWRLFHLSNASGLVTAAETFSGPRRGYNPNDPSFTRILRHL